MLVAWVAFPLLAAALCAGLGLLALANQLGAAPQDITLIAAAIVAVPVDRARDLCGRPWDWIEAIAPAG